MKLLIIGGTGGTGKELIRQALEQDHHLTALVRDSGKVKIVHPNLLLIKGNILDPGQVRRTFDAVLSAPGHKKFIIKTTILSTGTMVNNS